MKNTKAFILQLIGIIYIILGIIGSVILGVVLEKYIICIIGAVSCFVVGMLFIGFAEIINILHINTENQQKLYNAIKDLKKN